MNFDFGMTFYICLVFHFWNFGVAFDLSANKFHCQGAFDRSVTFDLLDHFTFQANPWIFDDIFHCERPLCDLSLTFYDYVTFDVWLFTSLVNFELSVTINIFSNLWPFW